MTRPHLGRAQVQALIGAWQQIVGAEVQQLTPPDRNYQRGRYDNDDFDPDAYAPPDDDAGYWPDGEPRGQYYWANGQRHLRHHHHHHRHHHHHNRYQPARAYVHGEMSIRDDLEPRNWLIEEPGPDRAGREILPMSSGTQVILPNHSASITARPQRVAFRPERVFISENGDGAANWLVNDILIGNRSQFSQAGQIPGDIFATTAIDSFVSFETAQTAMDVVMVITYVGPTSDGQPFYGAIIGTAAV